MTLRGIYTLLRQRPTAHKLDEYNWALVNQIEAAHSKIEKLEAELKAAKAREAERFGEPVAA